MIQAPEIVEHQILDELEEYVKLFRLGDQRSFDGPALAALSVERGDSILELLEVAVSNVPDERYRLAAFHLLVDPENRTSNLTARNANAAAAFGVAADTFRKKANGVSPRSEVLGEVAAQLATLHEPPGEPPTTAAETTDDSLRRLFWAVPALGLVIAVGIYVTIALQPSEPIDPAGPVAASVGLDSTEYLGEVDVSLHCETTLGSGWVALPDLEQTPNWICRSPTGALTKPADMDEACEQQYGASSWAVNDGEASSWRCGYLVSSTANGERCALAAGMYDPSLSNEFAPLASGFRDRYEAAGGRATLGCPRVTMHRWAAGVMQELGDGDVSSAALLALGPDHIVLLEGSAWQAFDRIKGINGEFVGFPLSEPEPEDGYHAVRLSAGGSLVSQHPDGPYVWLPPVILPYWKAVSGPQGCLGFPITDPFASGDSFKQDFQRGRMVFSPVTASFAIEGADCD